MNDWLLFVLMDVGGEARELTVDVVKDQQRFLLCIYLVLPFYFVFFHPLPRPFILKAASLLCLAAALVLPSLFSTFVIFHVYIYLHSLDRRSHLRRLS